MTANRSIDHTEAATAQTALPGRIVDVVHLAAIRTGRRINTFSLSWRRRVELTVHLDRDWPRDVHAAQAVFAQLGITEFSIEVRPGIDHATVTATVPALDDATLILVIDPIPAGLAPVDPAGLLDEVDTRRAHTDGVTEPGQPVPVPPPAGIAPTPAPASRVGSSGERAVRFEARFESTCPACEQLLAEDAPASWLDGDVVHDTCAEAAGIDVYDLR